MAITLNHLVYDILELASAGGLPNEFPISTEQIKYWIEQTRAQLIGQSLNKKDDINDSWIQVIKCLEMEQVDSSLCCLAPSDCKVLKSVKQIPSTIDTWKDNWIISVTTMDGSSVPKSNFIKNKYQQYNKYTKKERSWFLMDDYLYIINDPYLETVNLYALFEFPTQLSEFVSCDGDACFTADSNYPITVSMASVITDMVVKNKVMPFLNLPKDNSNDGISSTPKQIVDNKNSE